jgi:hypothetical protein
VAWLKLKVLRPTLNNPNGFSTEDVVAFETYKSPNAVFETARDFDDRTVDTDAQPFDSYMSIFRRNDQEILKMYHDDYAPLHGSFDFRKACISRSQFTEKRHSFDIKVRAVREDHKSKTARGERGHGMDHSFRARIQRTERGAKLSRVSSDSLKRVQQKVPRVSKALRVTAVSFKNAHTRASQSSPGKFLSALSFNRKQFGCATHVSLWIFVHV